MNENDMIHKLRKAAKRGDAEAAVKLAECYMKGEGVERSQVKALKWWRKAVEQEDPARKRGRRKLWMAAAVGLALVIGGGIGAYYVLREDPYVAYQRLLKNGKGSEAVERLREAVEDGNVSAQAELGECYANGTGVNKDTAEARKWYQKAADQGQISYKTVSESDMIHKIREAAERGDAEAAVKLGESYMKGEGVERNEEEAVKWFRLAAEQGDADAQNRLGCCYWDGKGVSIDLRKAVKWWYLAAQQGHEEARNNLGEQHEPMKKGGRRELWTTVVAWLVILVVGCVAVYYMMRGNPYATYQRLIKAGGRVRRWSTCAKQRRAAKLRRSAISA